MVLEKLKEVKNGKTLEINGLIFGINKNKKMDSPDEEIFSRVLNYLGKVNGSEIKIKFNQEVYIELQNKFIWNNKTYSRILYYPDLIVETEKEIIFFEVKGVMKAVNQLKYKTVAKKLMEFEKNSGKKVKFSKIKFFTRKTNYFEQFMDYDEHSKNYSLAKRLNKAKEKELNRKLKIRDPEKVIDWKLTKPKFYKDGLNGNWIQVNEI